MLLTMTDGGAIERRPAEEPRRAALIEYHRVHRADNSEAVSEIITFISNAKRGKKSTPPPCQPTAIIHNYWTGCTNILDWKTITAKLNYVSIIFETLIGLLVCTDA